MNKPIYSDIHWNGLRSLSVYRLLVACILMILYYKYRSVINWDGFAPKQFEKLSQSYIVFCAFAFVVCSFRRTFFKAKLVITTILDIAFMTAIMHAIGGIGTGFGLLILISTTLASLVASGRLALFFAVISTCFVIGEQFFYRTAANQPDSNSLTQAIILSLSFFAISWLAYNYSKRSSASEAIATQHKIDLQNMEHVNLLITQEMRNGVIVVDNNFVIRHYNLPASQLLNFDAELPNDSRLALVCPTLFDLLLKWLHQSADNNTTSRFNQDGREIGVRLIPIDDGHKNGVVIFLEDWSEAQTQAQQSKLAAMGRLTASIAHEIRNPLSAISHANQLIGEDPAIDDTTRRLVQIIGTNVTRLDQMVKDILELNRRDRTKQSLVDVQAFIREFHHSFCEIERIEPGQFELDLPQEPVQIMFDPRHLQQTLWNLCKNGWRHSRQQEKCLKIAVNHSSVKTIDLQVIDDGDGVPEKNRPHIFEPFFTTESTGTGLGLYITRELCEANGATLSYAYENQHSIFNLRMRKQN